MKKIVFLCLLSVFVISPLFPLKASAISNYNNLIDDAMFDNVNSMNAPQIDTFLNAFPGSCISTNNGFSAPLPTGYTPSTKYQYSGNVSAGSVIAAVSRGYGINPQVLLATLQKEQGLVKGDGSNIVRNGTDCGALAISASVGYNCPDSLHLTSYSGFTLYAHNGVPVTSVDNTCVEHQAYVGFSQQLTIAAWQLSFDRHRSEGLNNWYANSPGWDNSDDLSFCYSGKMIEGGPFKLCPDNLNPPAPVKYSGLYTIDNTTVHMDDGATAALYNYTPHLHGQALFVDTFVAWFGSTYLGCTGSEPTLPQVSSLYNPTTYDHFYSSLQCEINLLTLRLGYHNEGYVYNTTAPSTPDATPIYRLYNPIDSRHIWTSSLPEAVNLTHNHYVQEGTAYYTSPASLNPSYPVYRLFLPKTGDHLWTQSFAAAQNAANNASYNFEGPAFYSQ